jgi:hypothetical protein
MTMPRYDNRKIKTNNAHKSVLSRAQFESLVSQIPSMTPTQLHFLQREIVDSIHPSSPTLLTDDELDLISSLF